MEIEFNNHPFDKDDEMAFQLARAADSIGGKAVDFVNNAMVEAIDAFNTFGEKLLCAATDKSLFKMPTTMKIMFPRKVYQCCLDLYALAFGDQIYDKVKDSDGFNALVLKKFNELTHSGLMLKKTKGEHHV